MSKVLIDRGLLSVASLHLEYSGYTETGKKLRALLDTPRGTPVMPVKAYYHEWTDLEGVRTRSVGLEVRKEFADAPLVLEADALARIACLEGEIAKRDARIMGLESQYQRDVWGLNNEGDPIGGEPAGGYANDNARLRSELAALKAQEPVGWYTEDHLDDKSATTYSKELADRWVAKGWPVFPLYAAPVSGAKAHGVVQWPEADEIMQMAFEEGQPADDASGYCFELEEFDLFIERLMSEVARLNAAPVQQVSVPDGKVCVPVEVLRLYEFMAASFTPFTSQHEQIAISLRKAKAAMLAAAPAAPAADAGHIFYGMDGNHP